MMDKSQSIIGEEYKHPCDWFNDICKNPLKETGMNKDSLKSDEAKTSLTTLNYIRQLAANGNKNAGDSDDYEDDHDENDEFVILVGLYEGLKAATYNAAVTNTVIISALKELKHNRNALNV
uniref:Uncharacterized protein n=1 Tax=Glossina pallidipes TaxID=7398 RepID=A0A1B0AI07_GLOPL